MTEPSGATTTEELAPAPAAGSSSNGRRLARVGLAAAMVSRLLGRLVGIVLVVVLARVAAPETVAVYGYLLGTATLVTVLTDLGVAAIAGREVAAGRLPASGALRAALGPQVVTVAAAAVLTLGLTSFLGPASVSPAATALTVALVVVSGMVNLWAEVLRGMGRVVLEAALQLGAAVALAAVGTLVIVGGGDVLTLLAVVVLKEVAVLCCAVLVLRPRRHVEARTGALLSQGVWVAVASAAIVLLWRQGTLVVGATGGVATLAAYVVATRFFDAGVTIAHTVGFGLTPGLSALATDRAAFRQSARRYLLAVSVAGAVVAAVGALLAGPLTTVPFGEQWTHAVPAVRLVAVSALPVLLCYLCASLLMARGQVRWMALSAVAGTVVGVVATGVLVHLEPDAARGVLGTLIGVTVVDLLLLLGLRDLVVSVARPQQPGGPDRTQE